MKFIFASILFLCACQQTSTPNIDDVKKPVIIPPPPLPPPNRDDVVREAAKAAIELYKNAPAPKKLTFTPTKWIPTKLGLENFAGSDVVKQEVIGTIVPDVEINNALTFYHAHEAGGAFANTFAARNDIEYRGEKDPFVELLWQAEKLSRMADNPSLRGNFSLSLKRLQQEKNNLSWPQFPGHVRTLLAKAKPQDFFDWDDASTALMEAIHAARFKVEPELFLALIATPFHSVIVENTRITGNNRADARWGNGIDGKGLNLLGLIYMTHRQRFLREFKKKHPSTKFDASSVEHVMYMLTWLNNYDGSSR